MYFYLLFMNHYLFSYGTLQQENVQFESFGRRLIGSKDSLCGYRIEKLEITDENVLRTSGEQFHPIAVFTGRYNDCVTGTVFTINQKELLAADSYEVSDYKRILVKLKSGIDAWVYVGN